MSNFEKYILCFLTCLQMNVKLYHWKTSSYDKHKITDELYNTLSNEIDSFVEVYQGQMKLGERLVFNMANDEKENCLLNNKDDEEFIKYINECLGKMEDIKNKYIKDKTQLINIVDNMIASINKAMYLLGMK